ncbi:MAG: class I SAM-dependent methyltransferase [Erysipelotrichales bacterium]|nr:class I SAM-dependent methyltransferase [Erysipelotrichales bacterium]
MNNSNAVSFAHELCKKSKGFDVAIDATLGNGHDSLFLSSLFKKIYAFDIQKLAIKRSKKRLENSLNVDIILDSYTNFDNYVFEKVDLIIYNLGFLPGSNHKVITNAKETIASIKKGIEILKDNGQIIIVSYTQHDNFKEYNNILDFINEHRKTINYCLFKNFEFERIIKITIK